MNQIFRERGGGRETLAKVLHRGMRSILKTAMIHKLIFPHNEMNVYRAPRMGWGPHGGGLAKVH